MKIIYVTAALPYSNGEAFIVEEVRELIRRGHELLVVPRSPRSNAGAHAEWMTVYTRREGLFSARVLGAALRACSTAPYRTLTGASLSGGRIRCTVRNLAVWAKGLWLADVARRWNAGHIHCHWAGTTATMAMIASAASGIPWSFTAHRWDIVENNALKRKATSARFVRAISEGGLKMMQARGVGRDVDLRVLRMGMRLPESASWSPPERPVFLCPANLVEVKGHRFLLEAWKILQARGVTGQLWLAGSGPLEHSLKQLAEDLGIGSTVGFLGVVDHDRLLGFYERNMVSAVVVPSIDLGGGHHEGIPVALAEAMGYAIPVVSTATGSIAELVTSETGTLVAPRDALALADALTGLLQDVALARQLGRSGRRRVAELHDIRRIAADLEGLFESASSAGAIAGEPRRMAQVVGTE